MKHPPYILPADAAPRRHRAMHRLPVRKRRGLHAAVLTLGLMAVWVASWPAVALFWGHAFALLQDVFGLPGDLIMTRYRLGFGLRLPVPFLDVPSATPGPAMLGGAALGTLVLFAASFFLPRRMVPTTYLVRALLFVHTTALVFFACWPDAFPYTAGAFLKSLTATTFFVITLIPPVLGVTFFLFDFKLRQKLGLALMTMGHLVVMVPLKYTLHAWVLHTGSLLWMPLLFLFTGVMLDVMIVIACYAWGMSWDGGTPLPANTPRPLHKARFGPFVVAAFPEANTPPAPPVPALP